MYHCEYNGRCSSCLPLLHMGSLAPALEAIKLVPADKTIDLGNKTEHHADFQHRIGDTAAEGRP